MQEAAVQVRVTAAEVAEACGVSQPTVSRILANGQAAANYSAETRQRVLETAQRLGYRPNVAARTTRTGRFGSVALVQGTRAGRSNLPVALLNGIQDALGEMEVNLMVLRLPEERLTDQEYVPRLLRETCSDGLLIDYTYDIPPRMLELIHASRLPAVWLNTKLPADCVHPDDEDGGYRATRKLIAAGHQRILYTGPAPDRHGPSHYSVTDRAAGYRRAMREAGLAPREWVAAEAFDIGWAQGVRDLLRHGDRPTALVAFAMPLVVITTALDEGLKIPGDLSIIHFGEGYPYVVAGKKLSAMIVPEMEMGRKAVQMLAEKMRDPGKPLAAVALPCGVIEGETIASIRV